MKRSEALRLRNIIEKAVQSLDNELALQAVTLHPAWVSGTDYTEGFKVKYEAALYKCLIAHTAQDWWSPANARSLWAKVLLEDGQILPWEQPDSTNSYAKGDKVTHNGSIWVSDIDNNVWEPGIYGWSRGE